MLRYGLRPTQHAVFARLHHLPCAHNPQGEGEVMVSRSPLLLPLIFPRKSGYQDKRIHGTMS
jgi:hypothetical protein